MRENLETKETAFKGFKDYEVDKVQRLYDWANQPVYDDELASARSDFHAFFNEHDKRRGTNFEHTFPELSQLTTLAEEAYNTLRK